MDDTTQEIMDFSPVSAEAATVASDTDKNNSGNADGDDDASATTSGMDGQEITAEAPQAEFSGDDANDDDNRLVANSTSDNISLALANANDAAETVTNQIDSNPSKSESNSNSHISLSPASNSHVTLPCLPEGSSDKTMSNIASSLLGSLATLIDSGAGESSFSSEIKTGIGTCKGGTNVLETSAAPGPGPGGTTVGLTSAPSAPVAAAAPAVSITRTIPTAPLLVNGNSILSAANNIISSIGTIPGILNAPLIQSVPQQPAAPVQPVTIPTIKTITPAIPAPSPSPVTITVRTPPGTGVLSQSLISNIVNTPEVQALLAKNPGQPITILRVPDAPPPAAVSTQTSAPVSAPKGIQQSTVPLVKTVTNLIPSPQPAAQTIPAVTTVLSNRLVNTNAASMSTKTVPTSLVTTSKPAGSPKPPVMFGLKKKVGRGGGKATKGMAPAVPSSQDLNLLRQKRPANCKTRSGRVSRPPLYRIKEYKTMSNEELADRRGSSEGEYSDYDDHETSASSDIAFDKRKRFKCDQCDKRYIGKRGLARHYRENPSHGDAEALLAGDGDKPESFEKVDDDVDDDDDDDQTELTGNNEGEEGEQTQANAEAEDNDHQAEEKEEKPMSLEASEPALPSASTSLPSTFAARGRKGFVPRGRGRGRGRPPGSGRTPGSGGKVVDESGDGMVITSESKNQNASKSDTKAGHKYFDPKAPLDEDLVKVVLPMLTKVITPWEYIVAQVQQASSPGESFVTGIFTALEEVQEEAKKLMQSCLQRPPGVKTTRSTRSPRPKASPKVSPKTSPQAKTTSPSLTIKEADISQYLGIEPGDYQVKDLKEEDLPKACRFLMRQVALSSSGDKEPKTSETVRDTLQRKRKLEVLVNQESPSKKSASSSKSSPPQPSAIKLKSTSSLSSSSKSNMTIGNIRSIADDIPLESISTVKPAKPAKAVKPASKRPIPPLGPISSNSKGAEQTKPLPKPGVGTNLPPLKPIKMATSTIREVVSTTACTTKSENNPVVVSTNGPKDQDAKTDSIIGLSSTSQTDPNTSVSTSSSQAGDVILSSVDGDNSDAGRLLAGSAEDIVGGGATSEEELVEQSTTTTTLLPEGTTIMQLEDGTFLLQKPDGTAMHVQTPAGMTIETVQALLSMEAGAVETTVEEQPATEAEPEQAQPQYVLDDGSCVQLPAGMSLDMAIEMGLINQSGED